MIDYVITSQYMETIENMEMMMKNNANYRK